MSLVLTYHRGCRYERVVVRVFENQNTAAREDGIKILEWLVSCKRPLKWREIQALFCIDPETATADFEDRLLIPDAKQLCGSLVDAKCSNISKLEDVIELVHATARE